MLLLSACKPAHFDINFGRTRYPLMMSARNRPPMMTLPWRHSGRDDVSNHQPHDCLLNHSLRRRSKKTSKLCVTGLCAGNSPMTGEVPAQMTRNAENVFPLDDVIMIIATVSGRSGKGMDTLSTVFTQLTVLRNSIKWRHTLFMFQQPLYFPL